MHERRIDWKSAAVAATLAALLAACGSQNATEAGGSPGEEIAAPAPNTGSAGGGAAAPAPEKGLLSRILPERAPAPPPPIDVPAGTRLRVRTTSTLSTNSNSAGESFVGHLEEDVVVGDRIAFPKGSRALGVVAFADKGGRVKGVASIGLRLTEIQTPGGKSIAVQTGIYAVEAKQTHTKDAQKIGIGAGVGAAIGAIAGGGSGAAKGAGVGAGAGTGAVLATRGDPAIVGAESVFAVSLENGVVVN